MKKQKKLLNFWNKIKKPLMILSLVGNILFILFIIVGCVNTKKSKPLSVYAENSLNGEWVLNNILDFSDINGVKGFSIDFLNGDDFYNTLVLSSTASINRVDFYYSDEVDEDNDYSVYAYSNTSWIDLSYQTINIVSSDSLDSSDSDLLYNFLLRNSSSHQDSEQSYPYSFQFNKQINYNAPFGASLESPFFNYTWEENQWAKSITYDFPFFVSNGEVFNRIEIWIFKSYGATYLDSSNISRINDYQDSGHYSHMSYQNTLTNSSVMVNYRNFVVSNDTSSDTVQTQLAFGSEWKNENYRIINFSSDLTSSQITTLSQFNNQNFGSNGFTNTGDDAGLGNVFTLLTSAFASFTSIFSIQLLPNITIGLLFFLPLIIGIILLIIWLIKR